MSCPPLSEPFSLTRWLSLCKMSTWWRAFGNLIRQVLHSHKRTQYVISRWHRSSGQDLTSSSSFLKAWWFCQGVDGQWVGHPLKGGSVSTTSHGSRQYCDRRAGLLQPSLICRTWSYSLTEGPHFWLDWSSELGTENSLGISLTARKGYGFVSGGTLIMKCLAPLLRFFFCVCARWKPFYLIVLGLLELCFCKGLNAAMLLVLVYKPEIY